MEPYNKQVRNYNHYFNSLVQMRLYVSYYLSPKMFQQENTLISLIMFCQSFKYDFVQFYQNKSKSAEIQVSLLCQIRIFFSLSCFYCCWNDGRLCFMGEAQGDSKMLYLSFTVKNLYNIHSQAEGFSPMKFSSSLAVTSDVLANFSDTYDELIHACIHRYILNHLYPLTIVTWPAPYSYPVPTLVYWEVVFTSKCEMLPSYICLTCCIDEICFLQ